MSGCLNQQALEKVDEAGMRRVRRSDQLARRICRRSNPRDRRGDGTERSELHVEQRLWFGLLCRRRLQTQFRTEAFRGVHNVLVLGRRFFPGARYGAVGRRLCVHRGASGECNTNLQQRQDCQ